MEMHTRWRHQLGSDVGSGFLVVLDVTTWLRNSDPMESRVGGGHFKLPVLSLTK